ncbi:2,4-dichlorophenol 6-monooxygenase [Brevibacterium siliguriense]|uniref:2,4-dichlorophenol 6-monooxygenase n=1 Tax=Brevibacterium siliguriense TaxID=1136497 RepID=A0A1H1QEA9_9MICO|nr:FAD-dependent monooxygenase [Brevibacterium siliguriense]SDS21229.1 2,4-dichlorophenol 6-monooxygenase [Brevibacterium siliguriense]
MTYPAPDTPIRTDVLVVGAGPAGLTLSTILARDEVDAITITRYSGTANSPRAHITNQRTMEVFRDLGLEEAVTEVATPNEYMRNNVWATSFAGQEIARLETWGTGCERSGDYELASPSRMCNIPQHILEPVILQGAQDNGADIRFSTELISAVERSDGVHATVRDRDSGEESTIIARYIVGADGGRSTVAEEFGFTFTGESGLGAALNIWLEADLTQYCDYRPGTLYWMAQPGNDYWVGSGTWICVKPYTEWVLLCMYDPNEGEPDISTEALIERARLTIGDPDVDITIKQVSKWQINHVVADDYRRGRAFLAGDAAHRHPPANGLGTNTSVQDAFNLGWKLSAVLRGEADDALLDTYSQERQPVGRRVVDRAMKSVEDMGPISRALGFEPGQSAEDGWASLNALNADPKRRQELIEAVELQHFQFNALGIELGQKYASDGIVGAGADTGGVGSDPGAEAGIRSGDPDLDYVPSTQAGSLLPHAWVDHERHRLSTLDLVGDGEWTLLTGHDDAGWAEAAAEGSRVTGREIRVAQVSMGGEFNDVLHRWVSLIDTADSGALLVRPDRVIVWNCHERPADPAAALVEALNVGLGRKPTAAV